METVNFDKSNSTYSATDRLLVERYTMFGAASNRVVVGSKPDKDGASALIHLIKKDSLSVAENIISILSSRRASKTNFGLFALALCVILGDEKTKHLVYQNLDKVCFIPTNLFMFVGFYETLNKQIFEKSGWGSGAKRAISRWYNGKSVKDLVMAVTKYKNREGWTHKDLLRLAHPVPATADHNLLYKFITTGTLDIEDNQVEDKEAFERLEATDRLFSEAKTADDVVALISKYGLVREHVPTQYLNDKSVWRALLMSMPATALLRNLGKMTAVGLFEDANELKFVTSQLKNPKFITGKVHPILVLQALSQYKKGHGDKGSLSWRPVDSISKAMDLAFEISYKNVTPLNKNVMIGLDVSGSMSGYSTGNLSARDVSVALTTILLRKEPEVRIGAFTGGFKLLDCKKDITMSELRAQTERMPFSNTDCSAPIKWAIDNKAQVDAFIILTDNENNNGSGNPSELLRIYRETMNRDAKMVVVCVTGTSNKTLGDPNDPMILEISGFDASTPEMVAAFLTT